MLCKSYEYTEGGQLELYSFAAEYQCTHQRAELG